MYLSIDYIFLSMDLLQNMQKYVKINIFNFIPYVNVYIFYREKEICIQYNCIFTIFTYKNAF